MNKKRNIECFLTLHPFEKHEIPNFNGVIVEHKKRATLLDCSF